KSQFFHQLLCLRKSFLNSHDRMSAQIVTEPLPLWFPVGAAVRPSINFLGDSEYCASTATSRTADRQPVAFPALHGTHPSPKMPSNLFPTAQDHRSPSAWPYYVQKSSKN